MTEAAWRGLVLPVILIVAVAMLRADRPATTLRLLRAELALTAVALGAALLASPPGQRRPALLAALLATAAEAGALPRSFGADNPGGRPRSHAFAAVVAALLVTGWTFAAIGADADAFPSGADRRAIATALSVVLVSALGFVRREEPPPVLLCRLASLGNAVLLLASVVPGGPAAAILAPLPLVPAACLASVLLPRLLVAADAADRDGLDRDGPGR